MSTVIGTAIIDLKADTTKLVDGMEKAEKTVKKSINNIKRAIISMAAAYAGLQGVKAFKNMIDDSLEAADATGKLAQKLGISVDALSRYQYAAKLSDISTGELNAGISAMIRRLNNFERDGGGAAKKALLELGISADYAREHFTTTDIAFKEILKRLEKMPDGFKKTAIAQDIFSKSASGMLRLTSSDLQKFGDEAERIGLTISQSVYEMAADYHDTLDRISARFTGMNRSISFGLIRPMDAASKAGLKMIDSIFGKSSTDKIKNYEKLAVEAIGGVAYSVGFIKDAFTGVELVIKGLEIAFYSLATVIGVALEPAIHLINNMISGYNYIAGKLHTGTIDFKLVSSVPDNINKVKQLSGEFMALTGELKNGRITSDEFMKSFKSNMVDIGNETSKTIEKTVSSAKVASEKITKYLGDIVTSDYFNAWKSLKDPIGSGGMKKVEEYFKKLRSAKLTYLETTNQYTSIWNMKEEDLRAKYAGLLTPEEIDAIVEKYKTDYFKPLEDMSKTTASYMENVFDTMNKSLTASFDSFFDYTSKGFMKFGDLASAVLHDVYMQIMKTSVINPMVSGIMGGITSLFTPMNVAPNLALSLKGYAHGDVFTPFATGGAFTNSIVTEPTPFAYGGNFGNLGVMGEAGSEAVMPLTRHRNGDLGVKATPSNVIINVENQSGIPVDMKQVSEVMNDDGTKTINIVMNAIERNPDFRQAIKGIR